MGKGFAVSEAVGGVAGTHVWLTPKEIIEDLGPFDLDPCAAPNWKLATNEYFESSNGLVQNWSGFVWLNPPYGKHTPDWIEKLARHGNGIALVFSRTDTAWFQNAIKHSNCVFFKRGRIKFHNAQGVSKGNAGAPSCFFGFGALAVERLKNSKMNGVLVGHVDPIHFFSQT
jgi:hypothetical protein